MIDTNRFSKHLTKCSERNENDIPGMFATYQLHCESHICFDKHSVGYRTILFGYLFDLKTYHKLYLLLKRFSIK